MKYKLGRLVLAVNGTGPLKAAIQSELAPIESVTREPEAILFRFADDLPDPPAAYSTAKPIMSWKNGFSAHDAAMTYVCSISEQSVDVVVRHSPPTGIKSRLRPDWWSRFRSWNYLTHLETTAKNFMYDVFDYTTQIQNLRCGQTYVHASSFEKDNRGIAVLAWGGIGKTTSMLKMVIEKGYRFLSDDLAVLDESGTVWRSPKRMQIYAYNLVGQQLLAEKLLRSRTLLDRVNWEWRRQRHGNDHVRRRVAAEDLFGAENVQTSAPLKAALFAERVNVNQFSFKETTADDIARRAAAIMMKELEPFPQICAAIHGSGNATAIPSYEEVRSATERMIRRGLAGVRLALWQIPLKASPEDIFQNLSNYLMMAFEPRK